MYISSVGQHLLRDTVIYCAAERYGLEELKKLALRKQGLQSGIDVGGSYSPDGGRIVFESDRSGSQQIYVMDASGGNQRRISFFGGRAATPEWSPRGDQIAFTHIAGDLRVAVMTPSGRNTGLSWLTAS